MADLRGRKPLLDLAATVITVGVAVGAASLFPAFGGVGPGASFLIIAVPLALVLGPAVRYALRRRFLPSSEEARRAAGRLRGEVPCPKCGSLQTEQQRDEESGQNLPRLECNQCGHVWDLPRGGPRDRRPHA